MTITTITYRRRVNLGNYENCAVEMTAQLTEEDAVPPSFETLREEVHDAIRAQIAYLPEWQRRQWRDLYPRTESDEQPADLA